MATESEGLEVVRWEGSAPNGTRYRVIGRDDSYGGLAWAIECRPETRGPWLPVSYGDDADAPECAMVAAHLARLLSDAREAVERAREEGREEVRAQIRRDMRRDLDLQNAERPQ